VLVGVVIGIVGVALLFFLIRSPSEFASRQEVQRLNLIAALVAQRGEALGLLINVPISPRVQNALEQADASLNARILIVNSQGQVLADSRLVSSNTEPNLPPPGSNRARLLPVFRDANGKAWLYAERPLGTDNYLVVAAPRPQIHILAILGNEFGPPIFQAAGIALLLALILAIWVARWVAAPLRRMADAADAVAASASAADFHPIPLEGPREVQTLGRAFNEMVERVQSSQKSQRDFVANVSHELKTPLTSIQGFAQAILDGATDSPEALHQAALVIFSESARMHRLVLELLDLARFDAGLATLEWAPLDLAELLRGLDQKFSPLARESDVDLQFDVDDLPTIIADADRLAQVFSNLIDNAIKHTPAGGIIQLCAQESGLYAQVSVSDTGPGIPEADLGRIFERFYQTDKSRRGGGGRGAGLGLAIAKEIVLAHGGEISAHNQSESSSGRQGSIFVVKLPLAHWDASESIMH